MAYTRKEKLLFLLSFVLLLAVYVAGMFHNVTRDAAKYAYVAKEMLETGNWLSLHIMGEPYLQKPQLLFWLTALSFKVFGVSNFAFRIPIIIFSLIGYYSIYQLGRIIYNKKTGLLAALMMAFSVVMLLYNSDVHTDILLQANVALSVWMVMGFLTTNKWSYLLGSGVALGLCILTKGPFGVLVPAMATLGYLLANRQLMKFFNLKWLLIIVLALLVSSPAFIAQYIENGVQGLFFFIWQNNVGRMTGSYMGTTVDPTFYIHTLLYLFLPWTVFLFLGIGSSIKKTFKSKLLPTEHFIFWATCIVFILLSISKSKLPNYVQVLMPFLAIFAARGYFESIDKKVWKTTQASILAICWVVTLLIMIFLFPTHNLWIWLIVAVLGLATIYCISVCKGNSYFFMSVFTLLMIGVLMNARVMPQMLGLQSQPKAAEILNREVKAGETAYNYNVAFLERKASGLKKKKEERKTSFDKTPNEKHFFRNYELMFYSKYPIVEIEDTLGRNQAIIAGAWFYTDEKGKNELLQLISSNSKTFEFDHFDPRRSARYLNPKTRPTAIEKMYLIHIEP